jgi:soluble lytic murein transglycosylase-like protein
MQQLTAFLLLFLLPAIALSNQKSEPDPELRARLISAINEADSFEDRFEAEVWLLDMSTRLQKNIPDSNERLELLRLIHREALRARLTPELVLAVIDVESRFDRYAISRVGAQGLMQVMPFWLKEIGHPDDNLIHAHTNLRLGCTILRFYLDKERGDLRSALRRYNGEVTKQVYADKVLDVLFKRWYKA